jgi:hypothetical protein
MIFYPPSRLPSDNICPVAREEYHRHHPRAAITTPLSYVCPTCEQWFASAELHEHFQGQHPEELTVIGIRNRHIGTIFKYLAVNHPYSVWFLGEMRCDVQAVLSPFAEPQLGTVTLTRAPRDLIVHLLLNTWDADVLVNVDPLTGLSLCFSLSRSLFSLLSLSLSLSVSLSL